MATTRCKFCVGQVTRQLGHGPVAKNADGTTKYGTRETHTLYAHPVYSEDPQSENKKFWDASPCGKLELTCVDPKAIEGFGLGKEFYLDLISIDESGAA